jgi:2-hydroxychromene-2-carboxylate isomerase
MTSVTDDSEPDTGPDDTGLQLPTVPPHSDAAYDIEFFWDPICPFAWITSRWVASVAEQTGYRVDWRFISLRLINKHRDYVNDFPPGYEFGHTAGLRMLRVAAAIRHELGREVLDRVVEAFGRSHWDRPHADPLGDRLSSREHVVGVLAAAELPERFADALDDDRWDALLDAESELALSRTGRDVGTPIITFHPPDGLSFFGPVISRVPEAHEAVPLWDAVVRLASFPGFAEIKRSLRERPQLAVLGAVGAAPVQEDWQGGHRRGHLRRDAAG